MKKVLVSGYIGFGNFGDEALLQVLLKDLIKSGVKKENITVLSNNPAATKTSFDIGVVDRWNLFNVINSILRHDYLIFIGGVFQDKTSFKSFLFYFMQLFLANFLQKEVACYGVGVGPFQRQISMNLFNFSAKSVKYFVVRDQASKEFVSDNHNVIVTCDPAWGIEPDFSIKEIITGVNWQLPILGVSLRQDVAFKEYNAKNLVEKLSRVINTMKDWQILFIPCMNDEDLPLLYEIYDGTFKKVSEPNRIFLFDKFADLPIQQQAGVLASCDVVIGMRYHALLLAILGEHPVFGLVCDQKIKSLIEFTQQVGVSLKDDLEHSWNYFWQNLEYSTQKAKQAKKKALELNKKNIQLLFNSLQT